MAQKPGLLQESIDSHDKWKWMACNYFLKYENDGRTSYWNLSPTITLVSVESEKNEPEITIQIEQEKQFMYNDEIGWHWHKSWNIPTITLKIMIRDPESKTLLYPPRGLIGHVFAVKAKMDKNEIFHLIDVGLRGESRVEVKDNNTNFPTLKFASTSYNNDGSRFHLVVCLYSEGDDDNLPKILYSKISPPIFVDSRRSAREAPRGKSVSEALEPFAPEFLDKSCVKRRSKGSMFEEVEIKTDTPSLINYFTAPNIRQKVRHPLFLALRFNDSLALFYNTSCVSYKSEEQFIEELQRNLIEHSRTQVKKSSSAATCANRLEDHLYLLVFKHVDTQNFSKVKQLGTIFSGYESKAIGLVYERELVPSTFACCENIKGLRKAYLGVYPNLSAYQEDGPESTLCIVETRPISPFGIGGKKTPNQYSDDDEEESKAPPPKPRMETRRKKYGGSPAPRKRHEPEDADDENEDRMGEESESRVVAHKELPKTDDHLPHRRGNSMIAEIKHQEMDATAPGAPISGSNHVLPSNGATSGVKLPEPLLEEMNGLLNKYKIQGTNQMPMIANLLNSMMGNNQGQVPQPQQQNQMQTMGPMMQHLVQQQPQMLIATQMQNPNNGMPGQMQNVQMAKPTPQNYGMAIQINPGMPQMAQMIQAPNPQMQAPPGHAYVLGSGPFLAYPQMAQAPQQPKPMGNEGLFCVVDPSLQQSMNQMRAPNGMMPSPMYNRPMQNPTMITSFMQQPVMQQQQAMQQNPQNGMPTMFGQLQARKPSGPPTSAPQGMFPMNGFQTVTVPQMQQMQQMRQPNQQQLQAVGIPQLMMSMPYQIPMQRMQPNMQGIPHGAGMTIEAQQPAVGPNPMVVKQETAGDKMLKH